MFKVVIILVAILEIHSQIVKEQCDNEVNDCQSETNTRYMFYDVNPPEGFNLRRDVYMRFAVLAHKLSQSKDDTLKNFRLVLPPWSNLYHWQRTEEPEHIPWGLFFDMESLQKFAPVIEMHQFFTGKCNVQMFIVGSFIKNKQLIVIELKDYKGDYNKKVKIDDVYILQHFKEMFETEQFVERMSIEECNKNHNIQPQYFYYHNISSDNVHCLSFHGSVSKLIPLLETSNARTIMFDHGEIALHDTFGDETYWQCRRSMRFNKELVEIATEFRSKFLNSDDIHDNTERTKEWQLEKPKRNAIGGPYMSVHLRRQDFVWGRRDQIPDIESAAKQIKDKANKLNLDVVFIATDSGSTEFEELKEILSWHDIKAIKFNPNKEIKKKYKDGGIAIIEQIICSHAKYFMGTHESTFSFRIQEEREILGFPVDTTFNRICGNKEGNNCNKPSIWKIVHDEL